MATRGGPSWPCSIFIFYSVLDSGLKPRYGEHMAHETIDYPGMIDTAMRQVVRDALIHVDKFGLPGDHHFFISFQTNFPGVSISPQLKSRYPEEITIVVQHQFWDLKITDKQFAIMLSFNNIPEKLVVPFDALTAFADPSIKFGLQFHGKRPAVSANDKEEAVSCPATGRNGQEKPPMAAFEEEPPSEETNVANDEKVISLEAFRKR